METYLKIILAVGLVVVLIAIFVIIVAGSAGGLKAEIKIDIEKKAMNNICHQEQDTNKLLEILIHNKVTPIALEDIITDIQSV